MTYTNSNNMGKPDSAAPRPGEGKRGTAGRIGYLLMQAASVFRLAMARALSDLDVTPPQFSVLTIIDGYPGISSADIARLSLLTPQTLSVIVSNLLRAGTIARSPHPVHGRIQRLALTAEGATLLATCRLRVHALEHDLEAALSSDQSALLRGWLVDVARTQTRDK
ncbi:MarR family winged helix-turn-helix transcriptional regulator [Sphingopyxis sp.]|uniref:MarR family winged helix-turn-helix transcriptional regulator n=1 Tax=Sphingopyxis sp. TaxID=1908224 RepID=UPI003D6C9773